MLMFYSSLSGRERKREKLERLLNLFYFEKFVLLLNRSTTRLSIECYALSLAIYICKYYPFYIFVEKPVSGVH